MSTILAKPRSNANTRRRGSPATMDRRHDYPMTSEVEHTPLHAAVVVPSSEHASGPISDREMERFIANEMLLLCDKPGKTSTRAHLETFLQDLLDDKRCRYDMVHSRYDPQRVRSLFTVELEFDEGYLFVPDNNRLLLLYRSGKSPVLGAHLVDFMVKKRKYRHEEEHIDESQLPIYAEDGSTTDDSRCHLPIPKLLTVDLVEEIRKRVADVTEIWLQFPTDRAPFLIVMNRYNQYDYLFGEQNGSTLDPPWSHATSLRFRSNTCDETHESNRICGTALYQCEEGEYYGRTNDSKPDPRYQRAPYQRACDRYLDHLYNGFVGSGNDAEVRRCQLQLVNPGSGVIHCDECAHASAKGGGLFYHVQYAPLTSTGLCPIARYVLRTLSKWYEGAKNYDGDASEFDVTTPVVHDIRMALRKRRVLHKVLAVDAIKKGAEPAPGTTAFAVAMGRAYGTRYGKSGHVPFESVDDCLQSPEYNTNKMLHYFAKGFNDTTGRPLPEWGREGDMDWRGRVCESMSTVKKP